jgi:hypothetical protein
MVRKGYVDLDDALLLALFADLPLDRRPCGALPLDEAGESLKEGFLAVGSRRGAFVAPPIGQGG